MSSMCSDKPEGSLPAIKLCNNSQPFNPVQGEGPLGNQHAGKMFYQGGDKEERVKDLQKMLVELGLDIGPSGVDGDFGSKTEQAVREFQQNNKDWDDKQLKDDSLVGPRTADALNRNMVGRLYDCYSTPNEFTKDFLLITATSKKLSEGLEMEPEEAKKIRLVIVGTVASFSNSIDIDRTEEAGDPEEDGKFASSETAKKITWTVNVKREIAV